MQQGGTQQQMATYVHETTGMRQGGQQYTQGRVPVGYSQMQGGPQPPGNYSGYTQVSEAGYAQK